MSDNLSVNAIGKALSVAGVATEKPNVRRLGEGNPVVRLERMASIEQLIREGRRTIIVTPTAGYSNSTAGMNSTATVNSTAGTMSTASANSTASVNSTAAIGSASAKSEGRESDLLRACSVGDYDRAKDLIDAGAKVSGELLFQVIHSSSDAKTKFKLIDLLLSSGADVNHMLNDETPLEAAISLGLLETIKLLIQRGAKVYDSEGACIFFAHLLSEACEVRHGALVAMLAAGLEDEDPRRRDWVSNGLNGVIRRDLDDEKKERLIKHLLAKGADVNYDFGGGCTALHLACGYDDEKSDTGFLPNPHLVRVLCENDANVNAALENGYTALHILCDFNDAFLADDDEFPPLRSHIVECIEILRHYGAEVDTRDNEGNTPLHLSCQEQMTEFQLTRVLCETGASVNATGKDGRTALHILCAAFSNPDFEINIYDENEEVRDFFIESVKILLEHAAEVDITDDNGDEPFILAVATGKDELVDLLLDHQMSSLPEDY